MSRNPSSALHWSALALDGLLALRTPMAGVRGAADRSNGLRERCGLLQRVQSAWGSRWARRHAYLRCSASTRPPGVYDRRGLSALREGPWSASSRAETTRLERIRALDEECPNPEAVEIPSVRMLRVLYPLLFARLIPSARSAPHTACPASSRRHVRGRDATLAGNGRATRPGAGCASRCPRRRARRGELRRAEEAGSGRDPVARSTS